MKTSKEKDDRVALGEKGIKGTVLAEFIRETSLFDAERTRLVEEILWGLETEPKEAVRNQIYLYGSQVKAEELFARQLFLWFLGMLEEREERV